MCANPTKTASLAKAITRAASRQTFDTIRLLADRGRCADAYRTYAYFRWVDDRLDGDAISGPERQSFVTRQLDLIERCYAGEAPSAVSSEESMLVDLIRHNPERHGLLASYVHNMMAVMTFDAARRGRLITQAELNTYEHHLAVAVTEALHYFIGRGQCAPMSSERYLAVRAAHITHMLRDTYDDIRAGYFNIPVEFVSAYRISPLDVDSPAYLAWVRLRVELARRNFKAGGRYLKQVPCARFRMAVCAYAARFHAVLDRIEGDGFALRADYRACKTLSSGLQMLISILGAALGLERLAPAYGAASEDRAPGRQ